VSALNLCLKGCTDRVTRHAFVTGDGAENREGPDIGLLSYTTCFDGGVDQQHTQEMFCHAKCLQLALNRSCPLYVLDLVRESHDTE
jgi:hypothetical protein